MDSQFQEESGTRIKNKEPKTGLDLGFRIRVVKFEILIQNSDPRLAIRKEQRSGVRYQVSRIKIQTSRIKHQESKING